MSYLKSLDPDYREKAIIEAVLILSRYKFDSIAIRGVSGLLVGPEVARRLNKNLVIVRKGESCHGRNVESSNNIGKYVILDDFVDSGATVISIREGIETYHKKTKCVGAYMYIASFCRRPGRFKSVNRDREAGNWYDDDGNMICYKTRHPRYIKQLDNGLETREGD